MQFTCMGVTQHENSREQIMLCLIMEFLKITMKYNDSDFTMKHSCEDYVIVHHCYRGDCYKTHPTVIIMSFI